MLDHVNNVKALDDQLSCLDVVLREEDVIMIVLQSLRDTYDYLIAALETKPMNELTMEYVTARLIHEVTKKKEKEAPSAAATTATRQVRWGNTNVTLYFVCRKSGLIVRNCCQAKNNASRSECR